MVRRTFFAGIALASFQIPSAFAQPPHSTPEEPCADCVTIPALTPIKIELLETLGSKVSTSGETFPFRLAGPVLIDGKVAIPAGTPGVGEVVHAKKSGGSGAAGELVLAARYLDVQGRRLRLRSLKSALFIFRTTVCPAMPFFFSRQDTFSARLRRIGTSSS